jgi:hypothetical protein
VFPAWSKEPFCNPLSERTSPEETDLENYYFE